MRKLLRTYLLSVVSHNLNCDTYIGEVYDWLYQIIPSGFVESVRMLVGVYTGKKQEGKPLRTFPRKPEDSRINFQNDLGNIYRLIRASSKPFSGAYAFLNNTDIKVTIFRAKPYSLDYEFLAANVQLMEKYDFDKSFTVAVNHQALRITDYSVDGKPLDISFEIICQSMRNRLT